MFRTTLGKLEQQGISRQCLDEILRSHLIEPQTLWDDDFEASFELRTQALVDLISKAMGKSITPESTQVSGGKNRKRNVKNGKVFYSRQREANSQARVGGRELGRVRRRCSQCLRILINKVLGNFLCYLTAQLNSLNVHVQIISLIH